MDQRLLVEQASRGDHEAFARLVRSAVPRLDRVARLIVRDSELGRDAVQEAWIRAWRELPGLRDPDRFDAWIYRLTVNACLDQLRRRRRRVVEIKLRPEITPIGDGPERAVSDREAVDDALRRLEPKDRAVVVLHYFVGLPLSETAIVLRMPVGTVKSKLHRALRVMRSDSASSASTSTAALGREREAT